MTSARVEVIRRRTRSALLARRQDYEVGCILLSQPVFFARDDWVADHADWHPRIQGGKTIDVARGDGQRVLAECLERTARLRQEAEPLVDELRRYGAPHTVQPRLGQGTFRIAVTSAYGACAVSGEHSLPALEAAHVRPYADGGEHALPNGLLLRADIHCLVRRRLRHRHARLPFPRQPRPRGRLSQRSRIRALCRPCHHRAACPGRSAEPGPARLARGGGVPRLSVTHHGRSSSLCGMAAPATLRDGMNETPEHNGGEVVPYSSPNGDVSLDVLVEHESVWLTQKQMAELLGRERSVISRHIQRALANDELSPESNVQKVHIASSDKPLTLYSLDAVISVGYRVNSARGTQFRIRATRTLREHLLRGYTLNERHDNGVHLTTVVPPEVGSWTLGVSAIM